MSDDLRTVFTVLLFGNLLGICALVAATMLVVRDTYQQARVTGEIRRMIWSRTAELVAWVSLLLAAAPLGLFPPEIRSLIFLGSFGLMAISRFLDLLVARVLRERLKERRVVRALQQSAPSSPPGQ